MSPKMPKRGSIMLFVLAGIGIFTATIFIFLAFPTLPQPNSNKHLALDPVMMHQESCLSDLLRLAVDDVASQGGYYVTPLPNYLLDDDFLPYYRNGSSLIYPSSEIVEGEIAAFMAHHTSCLGYDPVMDVNDGPIKVEINDRSAIVVQDFHAVYEEQGFDYEVKAKIDTPLMMLVQASAEAAMAFEDGVCISCLIDIAERYDVQIHHSLLYDSAYLVEVHRHNTTLQFLVEEAMDKAANEELDLEEIPGQEATAGYEFHYKALANDNSASYSDDTGLFDIDPNTGEIRFIPGNDDIGTHFIKITTANAQASDEAIMRLDVLAPLDGAFEIRSEQSLIAVAGRLFTYDINITDDYACYFLDNTTLFDISILDGKIEFLPSDQDIGNHLIEIAVVGENGITRTKNIQLEVLP